MWKHLTGRGPPQSAVAFLPVGVQQLDLVANPSSANKLTGRVIKQRNTLIDKKLSNEIRAVVSMEFVGLIGLTLSIPGIVDKCVELATQLHKKIEEFRHVRALLKESLEEHEIYTKQVTASALFVKDISPSLSPEVNGVIAKALYRLTMSFEVTLNLVERATDRTGNIKKWWFVLYGKAELEKSLADINKHHELFLRCLHYSVLFGGSVVGSHITDECLLGNGALRRVQNLRQAMMDRVQDVPWTKVVLNANEVPIGPRIQLHPQSTIKIVHQASANSTPCLVEYRQYDPADNKSLRRVRDIVLILRSADITMGILQCKGFEPNPISFSCELVFPLPSGWENPRTLRDLLASPENAEGARHSLTDRVRLATRLATAVLYVHTAKLVHKNIRPENIILLEPQGDDPARKFPRALGTAFLVGFDIVRKDDETSSRMGDDDWKKNIYRHPDRQGLHPESEFTMLHDIYSLGVVLLEIAGWRSFVLSREGINGVTYIPNTKACKFADKVTQGLKSPREIQSAFIKKAEEHIPLVLGEKFRDVVLMCLKSADGAFGDTLDEDGVMVGLIFIQRVLTALEEISL